MKINLKQKRPIIILSLPPRSERSLFLLCFTLLCCFLLNLMSDQLMGLAVYNSIALDIHFPLYCYRWVCFHSFYLDSVFSSAESKV